MVKELNYSVRQYNRTLGNDKRIDLRKAMERLFAVFGLSVLLSWGSMASADVHVSLKDVAQKVVLSNPEVLSKWHAFKAAGGDVDVARGGYYPRIDVTTGVGRETLKQSGTADREYTRNGYTLTLNQILYDGFATSSDVARLDKARLVRYFEMVDAAESAALEAARAYYDVIRYRLLMFLAENNYVEHRASYEQLLRRAQAGAGRRVDVEHAASRLALAELNLNTEAANLHDVMARYLRLVGDRPPLVMFGPAGIASDFPASESDALKMAFRQNPALRSAVENVESAQHDLEVRRSAFHPKLDLRMRNESTANYQGVTGTRQNNVAELVLSYNIFNGGADLARQQVYTDRKSLALDLRDKSCRDIRQTLSIAYNDVYRLTVQVSNLDLQVSSIEKTRDAYKAQFNIGQRSLLDLLDTENELLNARRTAVNADMDLALAYLRTQAGIGRLLEFFGLKRIEEKDKPDSSELARIVESEICPPDAPNNYLVDLDALTARALKLLDPVQPTTDSAPPRPQVASTSVAIQRTPAEELEERLNAWVAAWAARNYASYAEFYAPSFVPVDGSSRASWAKQRQQRLAKSAQVQVVVKDFSAKEIAKDVFVTEFEQHYSSTSYSDRTMKAMTWVKTGGQWLIEREVARPVADSAIARRKAGK